MDENTLFREATLRICSSLEVEKALWRSLLYIRNYIPADRMSFHVVRPESGEVETVAYANPSGCVALAINTPLPPALKKVIEQEPPTPRVRIVERASGEELSWLITSSLKWPDGPYLVMSLTLEDEILGVVALSAKLEHRYTEEHARYFSILHEPFAIALANVLRFRELQTLKDMLADDNRYLWDELRRMTGEEIIGADFGLKPVMELVRQVSPMSSPVLLLGETGSGKEVIATAIHNSSPRKDGPFIRVNCGAIPESLMDSELFGHEKGAFTGALGRKRGRFERAHGGTIFLDEIGELPLEAQVRLLRVLQGREIERLGGVEPVKVDIRVIAATHRNLDGMTAGGTFREDLYFRLKVFPIVIPPLRERRIDIPALVHHFIRKKTQELGLGRLPSLAPEAMDRLAAYSWPGNVRELENTVERALILSRGRPLAFADLNEPVCTPARDNRDAHSHDACRLDEVVARHIHRVLRECGGRVEGPGGAAEILDVNPGTLRHKMRKLGIPFGRKTNSSTAT